ncbi:serine hydrolase domain-containing protein [Mucilaginibacter calamicampi]|uniref:Serine hydrolase domain-containing protein n=1 Tax=Mucilaginibacter calamicampi TaxID=1302352 RepID=A0ABW2Z072_9SPHI
MKISILKVLMICLLGGVANAQHKFDKPVNQSAIILDTALKNLKTPAISVAVGINNKIVWAKAIGYQDLEKQVPANTDTKFRVGSSSKSITSVGFGKLLETGKINLDSGIRYYLPYFDAKKPRITIRQLASHSSGIRNYKDNEFNSEKEYLSIEESMKVFMYDTLLFNPGDKFAYATYNYTVLSAAMEQVAKMSFLDYMQKAILTPLKMRNTTADYKSRNISDKAQFYNYDAKTGKYKMAPDVNISNKWAGGGYLSTPSDLVLLGNALLNNTLLKLRTTEILWTPQRLNSGKINGINYAIGWKVDTVKLFNGARSVRQIHHGGSASGATAMLVLLPEYNMTISMLANRDFASADLFKYVNQIAEAFISEKENDN